MASKVCEVGVGGSKASVVIARRDWSRPGLLDGRASAGAPPFASPASLVSAGAASTSFMSAIRGGTPLREMLLDEVPHRFLQLGGVRQVAAPLGGPDVVDEHVAHQELAVGSAHQAVAQL
jgi:hypothetical protein